MSTILQRRLTHELNSFYSLNEHMAGDDPTEVWDRLIPYERDLLIQMDTLRTRDQTKIRIEDVVILGDKLQGWPIAVYDPDGKPVASILKPDQRDATLKQVGNAIRKVRSARRMSPSSAAKYIRLSRQTYDEIERNGTGGIMHIEAAIRTLGMNIDYFLLNTPTQFDPEQQKLSDELYVVPPLVEVAVDTVVASLVGVQKKDITPTTENACKRLLTLGQTVEAATQDLAERYRSTFS